MDPSAHSGLPAPTLIYGFLVLWGLADCFFGYRILRQTLVILLVVLGLALGVLAAQQTGYSLGLCLIIGGAIGLVAGMFYKLGLAVAGGLLGALLISPWIDHLPVSAQIVSLIVICAFTGALTIWLTVIMFAGATAITGAFRVVFGIYFFLGGPDLLVLLHEPAGFTAAIKAEQTAIFASILLAALGFFNQLRDADGARKKS